MKYILGIAGDEHLVTMRPDERVGIWQMLVIAEDGTGEILSSGPATINASDCLLIRPSLAQQPVSEAQADAFRESWLGLPEWTRTDIALDLIIADQDVEAIHVYRCKGDGRE